MHKTIMLGLCAAGLIASQNASSATLKCSDATGATRYDSWQYDGGPAPYPGMIVSSSSIILNDKVLDQTSERETIRRRKPEAIFEYDYAARVEIGLTEIDGIRTEIFGVLATVKQRTESGYQELAQRYVICESESFVYPPP
ncbi:MAG: hypothetical protein EHM68_15920 [Lysobacterales bacterium]|nr:MAG: hypothetical protein EHM68_15920 [Xanthomonadales bacterium]